MGGPVGTPGLAIRVWLLPHPVWNLRLLSEFSARLVPPTAVAHGESAGTLAPKTSRPVTPLGAESPSSPEEKFTEMPWAAPRRIRWFQASSRAGSASPSASP